MRRQKKRKDVQMSFSSLSGKVKQETSFCVTDKNEATLIILEISSFTCDCQKSTGIRPFQVSLKLL